MCPPRQGPQTGGARLQEDFREAFAGRLQADRLRCGKDEQPDAAGDSPAFEDFRRRPEIVHPSVCAGADDGLVDPDVSDFSGRRRIRRRMRKGDKRRDLRRVPAVFAFVRGVRVAAEYGKGLPGPFPEIVQGDLVGLDDPAFCPGFDRHVAHREAAVHGETADGLAGEFHGPVEGAVDADPPDDVENEILRRHHPLHRAVEDELDRSRDTEPDLAQGHGGGDVRDAHARRESAQRPIGAGMGIASDDGCTRPDQSLLGKNGVTDSAATLFEPVRDPIAGDERTEVFELGRGLQRGAGDEVVGGDQYPVPVEDTGDLHFFEFTESGRAADVVADDGIDPCIHNIARHRLVQPGGLRQDFFGNRCSQRDPTPPYFNMFSICRLVRRCDASNSKPRVTFPMRTTGDSSSRAVPARSSSSPFSSLS